MFWYVRGHDICESSNRGIACLARNSLFRAPYAVWFVAIVVNLRSESESVFVAGPQRLCFGMYADMTSVKAQTVAVRSWPEIHYSGHLTVYGSWSSWPTFGRRAASLFEPWPSKTLLWYVREHDICESSNRRMVFLTRNSLCRAPYAVWFVVILVNLRAASGKPF